MENMEDMYSCDTDMALEYVEIINDLGQSVVLTNSPPFVLTGIEGVGGVGCNIYTQKSPFQHGETYLGHNLDIRNISLQIDIVAQDMQEMVYLRQQLVSTLNTALGQCKIRYTLGGQTKVIHGKVEKGPEFIYNNNFLDSIQTALVEIYCADPLWYDEHENNVEMADWIGGLTFPTTLPMNFAGRSTKSHTVVENNGNIETPIRFTFSGPCKNPQIKNGDTGEFIKVNTSIQENELLEVTTGAGTHTIQLLNLSTGQISNAMHLIGLESTSIA